MELVVSNIVLKHSNGIDKEPLVGDLIDGELAINDVNGTLYQRMNTDSGVIMGSTKFQNFFNVSPQPQFVIPLTANEEQVIDILIDNYNASTIYGVNITGGTLNTTSNPFKWTLPAVVNTVTHGISISAHDEAKLASEPTPYQYITVSNISGIVDDAVILNSTNIDNLVFDTLTDVSVSQGFLIVNGSDILAETINFEQEVEDTDWSSYMTSIQVSHLDLVVGDITSLDSIKISPDVDISIDDNIYVKQEGIVKEVSVGSIENIDVDQPVKQICRGNLWSVFLLENGTLKFFGDSFNASIEGITNVKYMAVGYDHMAVIKEDNSLWVIGTNDKGQLGLGDLVHRSEWVFSGLYVKSIACVFDSTMVVTLDGSILSTGYNNYGQLGLGTSTQMTSWTDTGSKAKSVYGYYSSFYIIKEDGSLWSVGYGGRGCLGTGSTTNKSRFFATSHNAVDVFPGMQYCLIKKEDNSIFSCGYNNIGQLLLGNNNNSVYEFTDTGLKGKQVYTSEDTTHIVMLDNTIWVGGSNNYGEAGLGHTNSLSSVVTKTNFLGGDFRVQNHQDSLYMIDPEQRVLATGRNYSGQLDVHEETLTLFTLTETSKKTSRIIGNFSPPLNDNISFTEFEVENKQTTYDAYNDVAAKIDETGRLWVRGSNSQGKLGLGDTVDRSVWTDTGVTGVKSVRVGIYHMTILKDDGTVWSTGGGVKGQLGNGSSADRNVFTQANITDVKYINVYKSNVFAIKNDGTLWATGENSSGALGVGTSTKVYSFIKVSVDGKVLTVDGCEYTSMLIREDGEVCVVGSNTYGQLGLGITVPNYNTYSFIPVGIKGKSISCHYNSTSLIGLDNKLYTAGYNANRQLCLGNNSTTYVFTNTNIEVADFSMGDNFSILKKLDGTFWGIGYTSLGRMGAGTETAYTVLTQLNVIAKYIECGAIESKVLLEDGRYLCAGRNLNYSLTNSSSSVLSFIFPDGDDLALYKDAGIFNITTKIGTFTKPEWIYKNTLKSFTSVSGTITKDFVENVLSGVPEETINGLKYNYNLTTKPGRYLSNKITGLLNGELVTEIRTELEK